MMLHFRKLTVKIKMNSLIGLTVFIAMNRHGITSDRQVWAEVSVLT